MLKTYRLITLTAGRGNENGLLPVIWRPTFDLFFEI